MNKEIDIAKFMDAFARKVPGLPVKKGKELATRIVEYAESLLQAQRAEIVGIIAEYGPISAEATKELIKMIKEEVK